MLENEPFMGAFVKLPVTFVERLAIAAENHHARQARYCDTGTLDGALSAISNWIEDLEKDRTQPSPTPERGDLLIKQARGETWTLTTNGWRELAPIELVEQPLDTMVASPDEVAAWHRRRDPRPHVADVTGLTSKQVATDEPHTVAYELRYRPFGRSVVEDELDRLRNSDWPKTGWPAAIAEALDELLELENAVDSVIGAAERRDLGVDERLTAFRDGIDHARVTLLDIATRHLPKDAA